MIYVKIWSFITIGDDNNGDDGNDGTLTSSLLDDGCDDNGDDGHDGCDSDD